MQRMQMQSTNYIIMCIFLFIYLFFVKKELCILWGKHTFEEKVQLTNEFEIR